MLDHKGRHQRMRKQARLLRPPSPLGARLPGYLILFAPHAFAPQRQWGPRELEEGGDDVKSTWPLWAGPHTCYNGNDNGKQGRKAERIRKLSNDMITLYPILLMTHIYSFNHMNKGFNYHLYVKVNRAQAKEK